MDLESRVRTVRERYADADLSVAELLCDTHPEHDVAFRLIDEHLAASEVTYGGLRASSERLAAGLASLGVGPGDRVASLMGKRPELPIVMLATWRLGAVYVPLFTAFGPQAIAMRLADTKTRVVVADADQLGKLRPSDATPSDPTWKVVVADGAEGDGIPLDGLFSYSRVPSPAPYRTGGDGPIVHMLTSGTTGRPKGVVHPLAYVAGWEVYFQYGLGVSESDVYWCAADPGWAYGLYAAIITPLALGLTSHLVRGGFAAETTLRILSDYKVTNFAAAPTVYRALRAAELPSSTFALRCASSAGEPLTPDVNAWAPAALGVEVRDHYGQTELGMVLGNHHHPELRQPQTPGSMGQQLPGWRVAVLHPDKDEVVEDDTVGRIAVDCSGSALMTFKGYESQAGPGTRFTADGGWYLTGDAGRRDAAGNFYFSARDDDVIIMAGYRIGPFDVESVLLQHDAVAECAVIAVPDELRGESIEAVVVTCAGCEPSDDLAFELRQLVKERYAAHAYPRSIRFVDSLPKTPSGKIQRFALRHERRNTVVASKAHRDQG